MSDAVAAVPFLAGVKIVDLTQFEAGPSCTAALAWLGADVVKIENPKMGDPGRRLRPGQPDTDPYYFHVFNANKRSMTVNLKSPKGLALVKDMIRQADVVIENFAPGAIERLGLDYDTVKALNPGIIYAQIKGFGEGSPYEKNLAFDMIAQACGGTFSVTGDPDGPPTRPGISLGDTGTGMLMAITILGALYKRRETGEGHRLQVAMQDAIMHYMRINFATQGLTGKAAQRGGSKVVGINSFQDRGILQVMKHPIHRDFKMPGWPVRVDGKPPVLTASPVLGAHTDMVLDEWLGLNAQAIEALRANGAV